MHERVYIHILALVAMAVKREFDATIKRVCVEVFGDTFQGFFPTMTKSYPRMVAKLLSRSDHRDEKTVQPRPALNVDVVRCLVSVPLTGDIEPFLACLARATGGFIKFKNNYQCTPEELHELFNLRLVLVTIRLNIGRTFGQLCLDPAVQGHGYLFSRLLSATQSAFPSAAFACSCAHSAVFFVPCLPPEFGTAHHICGVCRERT